MLAMYIIVFLSIIVIIITKAQINGFAHGTFSPGVSVTVKVVGADTTLEICGPTGKWFGIGFDAIRMYGAYAIIASPTIENSLKLEERTLGNSVLSNPAGTVAPTTITVLEVTSEDTDTICALITRKTEHPSALYNFPNIFSNTSETDVIVAIGLSEEFNHMAASRAISTLFYTIGTMDPATQPTESPGQFISNYTQSTLSACAAYLSFFEETFKLSWEIVDDYIRFEITLRIDAAVSGWVGIGFGEAQYMHGQDIIKVNFERDSNRSGGGIFFAMDSYSSAWFPQPDTNWDDGSDDVFDFSGQFIDNSVAFIFKRPLIASDKWDYPILEGFQHFIIAYQLNCFDCKHDSDHRMSALVNWYTGNSITNLNNFDKVRLYHGITMILLFGFAYPSSSFVARYLRHTLWWKQAHQKIGSLGLMTSLTSAYFAISTTASGQYSMHGLLGIGCVLSLCFQFTGGFCVGYWFEHWKRNKWYNRLHYSHLLFAILLNCLAPVTMWYGWLRLEPYHVPVLRHLPVWFSYFVLLIIIGEIYKRYYPTWSKNSEYSAFDSNYHVLTWDEIGEKVSAGAAWIIIDKYVLDITEWQLSHPGGRKILLDHTGTDCTKLFHGTQAVGGLHKYAHSEWAKKQMARMIVGEVPSQKQNSNTLEKGFTDRNFSRYASVVAADMNEDSYGKTESAEFDRFKLNAFLENHETEELVDLFDNMVDADKETLLKQKESGLSIADLTKKQHKISEAKRFRIVKLLNKTKMSAADCSRPIVLLEFDIEAKTRFSAGDYVLLHNTGKGTVSRSYTPIHPNFILCDDGKPLQNERNERKNKKRGCSKCFERKPKPTESGRLFLLVRLYKKGRMSSIISSLNINNSLRLTGPFERQQLLSPINFGFGRQCWRRIILICGGTGITPMINALYHHLKYGTAECRVLLIWYNKTTSDVVCIQHLKYLKSRYPNRFWIDLVFSAYPQNTHKCVERELSQFATIHENKWNEKQTLCKIRSFLINGFGVSKMRSFLTNKQSKQMKSSKRLGKLGLDIGISPQEEDDSLILENEITDTNHDSMEAESQSIESIESKEEEKSLHTEIESESKQKDDDNDDKILEDIYCDVLGDIKDVGIKKRIRSNSTTCGGKEENKNEKNEIEGGESINIDMNRMGSINATSFQMLQQDACATQTVQHLSAFDRIMLSGPKRFVEQFLEWLKSADDLAKLNIGKQIIALD